MNVWELLAPLRVRYPDTRWMRPELLHLTLVFMGDVAASRVPAIEHSLASVTQRRRAYLTRVDGAGGHVDGRAGGRRGGVAWLTLAEGATETADLALDIDSSLGMSTYDDRRKPRPHLTVARGVDAAALDGFRVFTNGLEISWPTSSVVLMRSYLEPRGSRYEELARLDLATHTPDR